MVTPKVPKAYLVGEKGCCLSGISKSSMILEGLSLEQKKALILEKRGI